MTQFSDRIMSAGSSLLNTKLPALVSFCELPVFFYLLKHGTQKSFLQPETISTQTIVNWVKDRHDTSIFMQFLFLSKL